MIEPTVTVPSRVFITAVDLDVGMRRTQDWALERGLCRYIEKTCRELSSLLGGS